MNGASHQARAILLSLFAKVTHPFVYHFQSIFKMCLNKRWIYNKYIDQKIFVSCGHCEACQQEKANKIMAKINNTFGSDYQCFFVTLTYRNPYITYIRRSEIGVFPLPVYRDQSLTHFVKVDKFGNNKLKTRNFQNYKPIDYIDYTFNGESFDIDSLPSLNNYNDDDKIGICYYKDVQDYFKRLRQILSRKYGFNGKFLYFACSEYGSGGHEKKSSCRPHFHVLLFFPKGWYNAVKFASYAAWSYDDFHRKQESFQIAKRPASYVSGYVCKSSNLSEFFTIKAFRPKHSCSFGFGATPYHLSLASLKTKIDEGNLFINYLVTRGSECGRVCSILFPKYVANRYFPKFKGFHSLSDSEVYQLISQPVLYWRYIHENNIVLHHYCKNIVHKRFSSVLKKDLWFPDDIVILKRELTDEFQKFYSRYTNIVFKFFDGDFYEYARYFVKFHRLYQSELLKKQYQDFDGDLNNLYQLYDNSYGNMYLICDSNGNKLYKSHQSLLGFNDPNKYPKNLIYNDKLRSQFLNNQLHREQVSLIKFSNYGE